MILVTGAAGKTGRAVIRALASKGEAVRALVHRPEQIRTVQDLGAQEAIAGDLRDQAIMERAARGVRAFYHIAPNMIPDELSIGRTAIAAARSADVPRFVYHSVLHPQTEAMPHHWWKLRVEERLFESGLAFTILQPAAYMQNVLAYWDRIVEHGTYRIPYAAGTQLSMVDLEDVAEAVAIVLMEPGHQGAIYELAGPEPLSQTEVAAILSEKLGRTARVQVVSLDEWERGARAAGLGEYQVETLIKMFQYYDRHGLWGSSRVLGWLLDRPPTTFAAFVERTLAAQRQGLVCAGSQKDV